MWCLILSDEILIDIILDIPCTSRALELLIF